MLGSAAVDPAAPAHGRRRPSSTCVARHKARGTNATAPCPAARFSVHFRATCSDARTAPVPAKIKMAFIPIKLSTTQIAPATASSQVFTAVRPSPHSACRITAMTTGLTPYSTAATSGRCPKRTYIQAMHATRIAAGRMKQTPPITNPIHPARRYPM